MIKGIFRKKLNVEEGTIVVHIATSAHRLSISPGVEAHVPGSEKRDAIQNTGYSVIMNTGGYE